MAHVDAVLSALANPVRRAMIERLKSGEATVNELSAPFDMSQPAISRHVKVLEEAGLISRSRDAQRRPCRLEAGSLADLTEWLGALSDDDGRRFPRLDRLFSRLDGMQEKLGSGRE